MRSFVNETNVIHPCLSLFCLDSESLLPSVGAQETSSPDSSLPDNMPRKDYNRTVHLTSALSYWQRFSSLPPQHPLRFVSLCFQVFVFYLGYAYLQVSSNGTKHRHRSNSIFPGTYLHLGWLQKYRLVSHLLPILHLRDALVHADGLCWLESTTVRCALWTTSRSERSVADFFRASYQAYLILAALTLSTMGLSNYSVAYLNYP